jgi:hypothetical protein
MKKCSYCGAEYSDNAVACPVDQTPLQSDTPTAHSGSKAKSGNYTKGIGPSGRWLIFSGIPVATLAVLLVSTLHHGLNQIPKIVGETSAPYVVFFTPVVIGIGGMVLYEHFPKRLVIPLGIAGWIIGLSLIYWYFWFGPGAFGHH